MVYPFQTADVPWSRGLFLVTDHGSYSLENSDYAARDGNRVHVYPTEWPTSEEIVLECEDGTEASTRVFADIYSIGSDAEGRVCESVSVLIVESNPCDG